jgi:hypothetical protein
LGDLTEMVQRSCTEREQRRRTAIDNSLDSDFVLSALLMTETLAALECARAHAIMTFTRQGGKTQVGFCDDGRDH